MNGIGFGNSLQAGLLHPFTGADHMMLAIGMGMLMLRYRHSILGLSSLIAGLVMGFILAISRSLEQFFGIEQFVEYGITASVILVAIPLLSRKISDSQNSVLKWVAPLSLVILSMFHGIAHGLEVPSNLQASGFFIGMIISMSVLFAMGTGIMRIIQRYRKDNPAYQRILALFGLTAVFLS